ncbi:hypothetical protein [Pseudoalteromonas denitrificans]|uniref:DUF4124 domain-containing protein n=1 Tax=Pseudoalteromonas denitrificans DSM 6059 TaxID=1123010 RepID=A0A1I1M7T4_9GAMM|nr:hypothetical protein [Pseudoalteromonas denitrificans]SFC81404.1 hypothetical protein SAMN02745724_02600 [Pseudoalteromonas denitrificans DSM 6059]
MKYFLILLLLFSGLTFAEKNVSKCISSSGEMRYTTRGCSSGEREMSINKNQSLLQFAQKAKAKRPENNAGPNNSDLSFYLKENFANTDWSENVERSFLEKNYAVVIVDSFRLHKLEGICNATMNWIDKYPHTRFELDSMRFEFNTGESFKERYVVVKECDFELR